MLFLPTMSRIIFEKTACVVLVLIVGVWLCTRSDIAWATEKVKVLVQSSPLAGSQFYALAAVWPSIRTGDALHLVREADNPHDAWAIRVEWQGQKLGYVPRAENRTLALAMDQGEILSARVSKLRQHRNPWQRVEFEVFLPL